MKLYFNLTMDTLTIYHVFCYDKTSHHLDYFKYLYLLTSGHLGFMQITTVARSNHLDSQAEFVLRPDEPKSIKTFT